MLRGVILGGLAFATVLVAERQFESIESDIKRYNAMREMSGDPPVSAQILAFVRERLSILLKKYRPELLGIVDAFASDAARYMRISTM
jgi:hypothetical protein